MAGGGKENVEPSLSASLKKVNSTAARGRAESLNGSEDLTMNDGGNCSAPQSPTESSDVRKFRSQAEFVEKK